MNALALLFLLSLPGAQPESYKKAADLEADLVPVREINNILQREYAPWVFQLAALYLAEGQEAKARENLSWGLRLDPQHNDLQALMARLEARAGLKESALERARWVLRVSADQETRYLAAQVVEELSGTVSVSSPGTPRLEGHALYLLAYEGASRELLERLAPDLASGYGVEVRVWPAPRTLPETAVLYNVVGMGQLLSTLEQKWGKKVYQQRLAKAGGVPDAPASILALIGSLLKQDASVPPGSIEGIMTALEPQFGVDPLEKDLEQALDKDIRAKDPWALGVLALCPKDLKAKDVNFLFGSASFDQGRGVLSDIRFRDPDSAVWFQRSRKQAYSTTGFLLGVDRCDTPNCIRAYPHSLDELDQKGEELCSVCKKGLGAAYGRVQKDFCIDVDRMIDVVVKKYGIDKALSEGQSQAARLTDRASAQISLAAVAEIKGLADVAVSAATRGVELAWGKDGHSFWWGTDILMAHARFAEALALLDKGPESFSDWKGWDLMRCRALVGLGRLPEALEVVARIKKEGKADWQTPILESELFERQGQHLKAVRVLNEAGDKVDREDWTAIEWAQAYLYLGEEKKGKQSLERLTKTNIWNRFSLAYVFFSDGDLAASSSIFEELSKNEDETVRIQSVAGLGLLAFFRGEADKAEALYLSQIKRAEELSWGQTDIYMGLVDVYQMKGDPAKARAYLRAQADRVEAHHNVPWQTVGDVRFFQKAGNFAQARELLLGASSASNRLRVSNLPLLALIEFHAGREAEALRLLDAAVREIPGSRKQGLADAYATLAYIHRRAGRTAEFQASWARAQEIIPGLSPRILDSLPPLGLAPEP